MKIAGTALTNGNVSGALLLLAEPLSFWGGLDLATAAIVDVTHPQCGERIAGRVVAMRAARGSSSSSSALVEIARAGLAPAAIVLTHYDPILAMGALVASDLYNIKIPVVVLDPADWPLLCDGMQVGIDAGEAIASIKTGA